MNEKTNKPLTLGSLFSGSGGFEYAGLLTGITPKWNCDVEPFPIRVTTKRLPNVRHYGDICTLNGAEIEPVDIITGGFPCQSVSIAGKREGVKNENNGDDMTTRSGLFYEAVRIIKEMREATNGKYPRYAVIENVPGLFSSRGGEDFRSVLESICKIKKPDVSVPKPEKWANAGEIVGEDYSVAWRVLDAQGFGVPQRRRRIYLVADFNGQCAGKILFESEGVSGYTPQSRNSRKTTAGDAEESIGAAGFGTDGYNGAIDRIAATLGVNCGMSTGRNGVMVLNDQGGERMDITEDMTATLRAKANHPPVVTEAAGFCTEHSAKSRSIGYENEKSPTLRAGTVPGAVAVENYPADSRIKISEDGKVQTLTSSMGTGGNRVPLVAENMKAYDVRFTSENTKNARHNVYETDTSRTLDTGGNHPDSNQGGVAVVKVKAQGFDRYNGDVTGDVVQTLNACAGTSGNNQPMVFQPKAYGISSDRSNAMLSENPHAGIYEAKTSRTLDTRCADPGCHQGGMAVVCVDMGGGKSSVNVSEKQSPTLAATHGGEPVIAVEGNGARPSHQGKGYSEDDVSFTLNATEQHGVAYGIDRAAFNQGTNAQYGITVEEEVEPTIVAKGPGAVSHPVYASSKASFFTRVSENTAETLVASDYKDPPTVSEEPYYIVRRLTPVECARLQAMPDWWCDDLETENPTNEDIAFWRDVFETHRMATGSSAKPKSDAQIAKWLKNPYSDSAAYRMYGNAICVNCGAFVLAGIVYYDRLSRAEM